MELLRTTCTYYLKLAYMKQTQVADIDPRMALQFLPFSQMIIEQKTVFYLNESKISADKAHSFILAVNLSLLSYAVN